MDIGSPFSLAFTSACEQRRRAQFSRAPVSLGGAGTFYSSQEKGNGAVSGKPGRSGRKSFVATTEQRNNVKILVGLGVPQAMICQLVVNPQTGKPLDEGTLKKHFPREIAVGAAELHARMGSFMVANIFGMTPRAGTLPIKKRVVARNAVGRPTREWNRGRLDRAAILALLLDRLFPAH